MLKFRPRISDADIVWSGLAGLMAFTTSVLMHYACFVRMRDLHVLRARDNLIVDAAQTLRKMNERTASWFVVQKDVYQTERYGEVNRDKVKAFCRCRFSSRRYLLQSNQWPDLKGFFLGGFECATHRRRDRTRIDVVSATKHDVFAQTDYSLLREAGIKTVRDGLRWHLIESTPGTYDWSSFMSTLESAETAGVQVIWDLCHWGVPAHIDLFSEAFPQQFADFAVEAAVVVRDRNKASCSEQSPIYCPINEISFWSWVGGDEEHFDPYKQNMGPALKRQLVSATLLAMRAIRDVDPTARFIQVEPIIHISSEDADDATNAQRHTESQFEVWDMLVGDDAPELGGHRDKLDIIGVNYYWNNQWIHEGDRTPPGHELHVPLHQLLKRIWDRYRRPLLISETGTEAGAEYGWLGYVSAEVRQAHRLGVPVLGICLYPVMDYPGWDDDRHCPCGLIELSWDWTIRKLRNDLAAELSIQKDSLDASLSVLKMASFQNPFTTTYTALAAASVDAAASVEYAAVE